MRHYSDTVIMSDNKEAERAAVMKAVQKILTGSKLLHNKLKKKKKKLKHITFWLMEWDIKEQKWNKAMHCVH